MAFGLLTGVEGEISRGEGGAAIMLDAMHQHHLDNLRTALARGMTDFIVEGLVKAALLGGCTPQHVLQTAAGLGPPAVPRAVQRVLDQWKCDQAARKAAGVEILPGETAA